MEGEATYAPPCRVALSARVTCDACHKSVSLHTLKYRHVCRSMVDRIRRGMQEARTAVQSRAEAVLEAERASKYVHLVRF